MVDLKIRGRRGPAAACRRLAGDPLRVAVTAVTVAVTGGGPVSAPAEQTPAAPFAVLSRALKAMAEPRLSRCPDHACAAPVSGACAHWAAPLWCDHARALNQSCGLKNLKAACGLKDLENLRAPLWCDHAVTPPGGCLIWQYGRGGSGRDGASSRAS